MSAEEPPHEAPEALQPGRLTELLRDLAADPESGGGWQREAVPGERVGRFLLRRRLGSGGFGVVYEAHDEVLGRAVAVKAVRVGGRPGLREERLLLEAEAAARLSHPNIVTLHDLGRSERGPFLVLELLRGESLGDRLGRGPLSPAEALGVATDVARGLAHAHAQGVVHRDLKPWNVFLCADGPAKILDFGLARAFGHSPVAGGTPAYMAPEQRSGAPEDERTDVFALGVMLHQMLTGELPFGASGRGAPERAAPRLDVPGAPALGALVSRMLDRDPLRRPRDGREVLAGLEAARAELEAGPAPPSRPARPRRRTRFLLAAVAVATIAGVAVRLLWPPAPPATSRRSLVVADMANGTGDPELDAASGLLVTCLEQSAFVDVLPRYRLADLLGAALPPDGRIDEGLARRAARLARASTLLVTRLLRMGDAYLVEVRGVEAGSGERRFSFTEQGLGKEGVMPLLERVSARVRLALGEDPAAVRERSVSLGSVTGSMEAWRRYARGMGCFERLSFAGTFDACLRDLEQAVAIDPRFALAHLQAAILQFLQGAPRALQRASLERALRDAERVPPHDRLRMRGWAALLAGREEEAKGLLREAAEAAPEDKLAWWLAGDVAYHRDELAEALPLFRRVQALDPDWIDATQHLVLALGATGGLEEIRSLARTLEGPGSTPARLVGLCYARLWVDPAHAAEACARARSAGAGPVADQFLAIALLQAGERERLGALLAEMDRASPAPGFSWYMGLWLRAQEGRWSEVATLAAARGDPDDSWFHSTIAEVAAGSGNADLVWRSTLRVLELDRALVSNMAVHLAYLGDLRRAAEVAPYLPPGSPRVRAYEAVTAWRRGDLDEAIRGLRQVATQAPVSADPAIPPPLYLLGEALREAGRDAEAVEVLRRFLAMPLNAPHWARPRGLCLLALSLERLGDRAGAREAADALLARWGAADPGQPMLATARALRERLGPP